MDSQARFKARTAHKILAWESLGFTAKRLQGSAQGVGSAEPWVSDFRAFALLNSETGSKIRQTPLGEVSV
jgi:hypothetical protein